MIDDSGLLRRYAAYRQDEDFAELVRRHLGLVYRAALRRVNGDTHLAEDIAQQVFATLAGSATSVQRHPVLAGWLYVATRHAAANAMRSEQRRRIREQQVPVVNDPPASSGPEPDWDRLRPELDRVMDELPECDRHAVLLRFFANRPFAEIGSALHVSENAARMRVERALERLRTLLARRGVVSTSSALAVLLESQAAAAAPAGLAATVASAALAGKSAAASAGAMFFLTQMSATKIAVTVAGILVCGAVGTAIHEGSVARQTRTELAATDRQAAELRRLLAAQTSKLTAAESRIRDSESQRAALQKRVDELTARSAPPKSVVSSAPPRAKTFGASQFELAAANPDYRRLFLEFQRTGNKLTYGRLYRKLGLSPQQIADFEGALIEQMDGFIDAAAAVQSQGISVSDPSVTQLPTPASVRDADATVRRALGAAGYDEYMAYNRAGMGRFAADSLAKDLFYTNAPLTADQADRLTQVIVANTTSAPRTGLIGPAGNTNWAAVFSQVQAILAPPQLETLKASVERDRLAQQLTEMTMNLNSAAASGTGAESGAAPNN
jgi:RNA polymerase sigma factor (sigma-70 family)